MKAAVSTTNEHLTGRWCQASEVLDADWRTSVHTAMTKGVSGKVLRAKPIMKNVCPTRERFRLDVLRTSAPAGQDRDLLQSFLFCENVIGKVDILGDFHLPQPALDDPGAGLGAVDRILCLE